MNAYELADKLDKAVYDLECRKIFAWEQKTAADMLRQQADRIAELEKQTKPLSDEEILDIFDYIIDENGYPTDVINLARAIEERHGIK